jgi:hypothetical protein
VDGVLGQHQLRRGRDRVRWRTELLWPLPTHQVWHKGLPVAATVPRLVTSGRPCYIQSQMDADPLHLLLWSMTPGKAEGGDPVLVPSDLRQATRRNSSRVPVTLYLSCSCVCSPCMSCSSAYVCLLQMQADWGKN